MFYKEPMGVTVDGRDFGATSLASAGGFVKADMKAALDSGNTNRGFIHVPRPSPDPEETSPYPNIKYVYSLVGCKGTGGDPFDYMKELDKQAWKSIDTSKVLTASWTATSYARFALGETYLKTGSCVFKIAYFGASDWKVKYLISTMGTQASKSCPSNIGNSWGQRKRTSLSSAGNNGIVGDAVCRVLADGVAICLL